jgi:cytochrome c oxidase subunit II
MGRLLGTAILLVAVITIAAFATGRWWFPPSAAAHGAAIDRQFNLTLWIVAIGFAGAQLALAYVVWRYRGTAHSRAVHNDGNARFEFICLAVMAIVFVALAVLGQRVWAELRIASAPEGALEVEVIGQQFVWNFRYPGSDGKFGRTNPALYDDENNSPTARPGPAGIDSKDPAGRDDLVSVGVMAVPLGRPIKLIIQSKDVTHSFFVPELRIKQDAVPGMRIALNFTPTRAGRFEIVCAELCGLSHHRMRGFLEIREPAEFDKWLEEKAKE